MAEAISHWSILYFSQHDRTYGNSAFHHTMIKPYFDQCQFSLSAAVLLLIVSERYLMTCATQANSVLQWLQLVQYVRWMCTIV